MSKIDELKKVLNGNREDTINETLLGETSDREEILSLLREFEGASLVGHFGPKVGTGVEYSGATLKLGGYTSKLIGKGNAFVIQFNVGEITEAARGDKYEKGKPTLFLTFNVVSGMGVGNELKMVKMK